MNFEKAISFTGKSKSNYMKLKYYAIALAGIFLLVMRTEAQVNLYMSGAASVKDVIYNTIIGYYGGNLGSKNVDNASKPQNSNKLTMTGQMTSIFGSQTVNIF